MTNDIFNLFNFADEVEEKKLEEEAKAKAIADKEAEEALAKAKKDVADAANAIGTEIEKLVEENKNKAPKAKSTPEAVKFTPNEDTVIRFYGESLQISSYFSAEELAEGVLVKSKGESERKPLTEELLRKRMEKDFPELVKDFVEIVFIPAKNLIIPMIKAKKKGNCIQEEVVSTDIASPFSKIPYSILESFISLAKIYAKHDLEVHADVYYQPENKKYFLDIPKQTVQTYWVEVTEDSYSIVSRVMDAIKVLEIHSHHNMMALPSKQDNASERVPGMHYAIVGNVNRFYPDVYLRQFISEEYGHSIKKVDELFESPFIHLPSFDTTSIEVNK